AVWLCPRPCGNACMAEVRLNLGEAERGLPMVCMCCGDEATTTVKRTLRWHPGWVYVLILAHVLIYAIVAIIMTKKATINAPLCDRHKGHWFYRNLLIWGCFFLFGSVGVAGLVLAGNLPNRQAEDAMPFAG